MNIPYTVLKRSKVSSYLKEISSLEHIVFTASCFVKQVQAGNLDAQLNEELASSDVLMKSLVSLRDQMRKFSVEEAERNWAVQGLAKFVEILRANENTTVLADTIISNLVKYMRFNQGALYLINDDMKDAPWLEMAACYAYGRKKFIEKRIELGEGLIGQCALEKCTSYLTDIPENYIRITSGLGEALPTNILIIPLNFDGRIFGVIELAAFQRCHPYQISFVEKLAENIASTVANARTNERTRRLLKETQMQAEQMRMQDEKMQILLMKSQQQTEELRAHEEEMRQNLEELQAIQDELSRKNSEMEKIKLLERERADSMIATQKKQIQKIVERFGVLEKDYKMKIKALEERLGEQTVLGKITN